MADALEQLRRAVAQAKSLSMMVAKENERLALRVAELAEGLDGVSGLTGTWVQTVDSNAPEHRHVVRFSFEGETHFEDIEDARAAAKAYMDIIVDIAVSDLRGLLGLDPNPDNCTPTEVLSEACSEITRLRAEVDRLRGAIECAEKHLRKGSATARSFAAHGVLVDALAREDGEG